MRALLLLLVVLAAASSIVFGNIELAGYDTSALVDASWRWHSGQMPYADFPCLLPPSFYMLGGLAFTLFGVHWYALTIMASLLFVLLASVGLRALRGRDLILSFAWLAALFVPFIITNHLWHSVMADSFAVWLLLVAWLLYREERASPALLVQMALAMAALLLSKPNIALAAIAVVVVAAIPHRRLLIMALGSLLAGGVIACAVMLAAGLSPVEVFASYLTVAERPGDLAFLGFPIEDSSLPAETTLASYLLFAALLFVCRLTQARLDAPHRLVAAGGILVSLVGFTTDWEMKLIDMGPALLGVCLLAEFPAARKAALSCLLAACLLATSYGSGRVRMQLAGQWAGERYGNLLLLSDPFFGEFAGRDVFANIVDTTDRVMRQAPHGAVFFGPRLEFMYARFGIESPRLLPIWWHRGTSYAPADEETIIEAWKAADFTMLIFAKDFTRMPEALLRYIGEHYEPFDADGILTVYIKRGRERDVFSSRHPGEGRDPSLLAKQG